MEMAGFYNVPGGTASPHASSHTKPCLQKPDRFYPHVEAPYRKENFLIKLVRKQQRRRQFITDIHKSHLYAKIHI